MVAIYIEIHVIWTQKKGAKILFYENAAGGAINNNASHAPEAIGCAVLPKHCGFACDGNNKRYWLKKNQIPYNGFTEK